MLETLREDFGRLPELLALGPPEQPGPAELLVAEPVAEAPPPLESPDEPSRDQLGLF